MEETLCRAAVAVLNTPDPEAKARAARAAAEMWRHGAMAPGDGAESPADRPARPDRPALRPPREVPRRRITSGTAGRIALLHALTHIELNAIDLAFDIVARFAHEELPREFFDDWVAVGDDEARHFTMLAGRLAELDASYGDLPAHDGLWQAAEETSGDLLARLAVVPLVLEARGLDVTPAMIERLRRVGDDRSADILQLIHDEEIGHVAAGVRWFRYLCARRGVEPAEAFGALVRRHFKGRIKPPFNTASRAAAGLPAGFYEPLAAG
jgi:uncharacterized ferritin-like protein (DUF455 family)